MRLTEGNFTPEADQQSARPQAGANTGASPTASSGGGPAARDETALLSRGGSDTASDDPGVTSPGGGPPASTGGGRAVPDAGVFENQNSLGDAGSLDDSAPAPMGSGTAAPTGNDSAAGAPASGGTDALSASPKVDLTGDPPGDAATGGLPGTGDTNMPAGVVTGGAVTSSLGGS